ncbi:MAG: hypothetical protein HZB98_05175, partial [Bacteroidia bacterium]|nr:hypothetical protein [Bacteroidia bacterium]
MQARVQAVLMNPGEAKNSEVTFIIKESKSGLVAGEYKTGDLDFGKNAEKIVDVLIPITNCTFWTPDNPFLYNLEVKTTSDSYITRFGMRELRFNPETRMAELNGKPFFLRGT